MLTVDTIAIEISNIRCPNEECKELLSVFADPRGKDPIECEFCGLEFAVAEDAELQITD